MALRVAFFHLPDHRQRRCRGKSLTFNLHRSAHMHLPTFLRARATSSFRVSPGCRRRRPPPHIHQIINESHPSGGGRNSPPSSTVCDSNQRFTVAGAQAFDIFLIIVALLKSISRHRHHIVRPPVFASPAIRIIIIIRRFCRSTALRKSHFYSLSE